MAYIVTSSCILEAVKTNIPNVLNIVLFDHPDADQALVTTLLQNFSRLQDFHTTPQFYGPLVNTANFLVPRNASLFSKKSLQASCGDMKFLMISQLLGCGLGHSFIIYILVVVSLVWR